ncbi:MAG: hypothetical protein COS08_06780, partial [Euryarchaeota archaeon CG01_land_8_20_14_3_00_38_12]
MSGAEDAGKEVVANSLYRYVENNINDYLTENIYCSGSSFKCEKLSYTGNKLSLELSPSYSTYNIVWVACSDEVSSEFSFSTETKAQALVDDYTVVGKTAKSTS